MCCLAGRKGHNASALGGGPFWTEQSLCQSSVRHNLTIAEISHLSPYEIIILLAILHFYEPHLKDSSNVLLGVVLVYEKNHQALVEHSCARQVAWQWPFCCILWTSMSWSFFLYDSWWPSSDLLAQLGLKARYLAWPLVAQAWKIRGLGHLLWPPGALASHGLQNPALYVFGLAGLQAMACMSKRPKVTIFFDARTSRTL